MKVDNVKPYEGSEPKERQVKVMFDRIAFRYDFLNHFLSLGIDRMWRRRVVRMVRDSLAREMLDMATGTGDLAIMTLKALPDITVTGMDISPRMMEIAEHKIERSGLRDRMKLRESAAEELASADDVFDVATVAFGVRNFSDIPQGVRELRRSLKPGGKLIVLEFGMPRNKVFGPLFAFYFRKILPFVGGVISGEKKAYRYLQESVEDFPYGDGFAGIMRDAGFRNVRVMAMTFGLALIYEGEK